MCQEWKSGVKIGNAMCAGRPIITQHSAAFRELAPIGSAIETEADLDRAFELWADVEQRATALNQTRAEGLTLDRVAARYRRILMDVQKRQAA
jgi:hypothetical protein